MDIKNSLKEMFLDVIKKIEDDEVKKEEEVEVRHHYLSDLQIPELLEKYYAGGGPGDSHNDATEKFKGRIIWRSGFVLFKTPDNKFWVTYGSTPLASWPGHYSKVVFKLVDSNWIKLQLKFNNK